MRKNWIFICIIGVALGFGVFQIVRIIHEQTEVVDQPPAPVATNAPAPELAAPPVPPPAPAPRLRTEDQPYDPEVARRITVDEVKERMDKGERIYFIDTRSTIEGAMIKGALTGNEQNLDTWTRRVPKSALVVTYCS